MNQTSQHSLVFSLDDDQAETCGRPTPSMMMKTGTYDHPMTCDDGDGNEEEAEGRTSVALETRLDPEPPVESACLLELDPPEDVGQDRSPSRRPLSCLEEWCLGESWRLLDSCDLLLRSPLGDLWRSDPSELGRPTTETLEATDFLGSQDLEGRTADFSTSLAFDPELVAVLALLDLDDPSLLRLAGSWRASSGACISTESSIVSCSWDFFAAFTAAAALRLLFVGFRLSLPGLRQPILTDLTGRIFSTQSETLV